MENEIKKVWPKPIVSCSLLKIVLFLGKAKKPRVEISSSAESSEDSSGEESSSESESESSEEERRRRRRRRKKKKMLKFDISRLIRM